MEQATNLLCDEEELDRGRIPKPLRGTVRLLAAMGHASLCEFPLRNGRRADILTLDGKGSIWIVEVKSCVNDFRTDKKWGEYLDWCDRFFFAVGPEFPAEILPPDAGLIVADPHDGVLIREPAKAALATARRKILMLQFARLAAGRLLAREDPFHTRFLTE